MPKAVELWEPKQDSEFSDEAQKLAGQVEVLQRLAAVMSSVGGLMMCCGCLVVAVVFIVVVFWPSKPGRQISQRRRA